MIRPFAYLLAAFSICATISTPRQAGADISNFDLAGTIYTKWLYRNNDQMGTVTYGNPFWPENFSGDVGVGSEFDLSIVGRPSRYVTANVRIQSRWGSTWHDFFETGDILYPEENTSAASLGMDHAEYIKLRGYAVDINPPYSLISNIRIGSTDLGFFNPWTFGRLRYIDRDNAKGAFFQGALLDRDLTYTIGIVALPKLWAGPGWSTGIGDTLLNNPFYTLDYGYGLHLDYWFDPAEMQIIFDLAFAMDYEVDLADPDADGSLYPNCLDQLGNPIPGCSRDGRVDLEMRYRALNATLELNFEPLDNLLSNLLIGYSLSQVNPRYVTNGVAENAGVFPLPFMNTNNPGYPLEYTDAMGVPVRQQHIPDGMDLGDLLDAMAFRVRFQSIEPLDIRDLSFHIEYFNIGQNWVSTFGARREADVLLTDGFISGGQLPTQNIANEFQDFDEPWFESCIGWHGVTLLTNIVHDTVEFELETTYLNYNTNNDLGDDGYMIPRDVDYVYPSFLHNQGYTDTWVFDYANVLDRGRDPRAVYQRYQDRYSLIGGLRTTFDTQVNGLIVENFLKFIYDNDTRQDAMYNVAANEWTPYTEDDYEGLLLFSQLAFRMPLNDEIDLRFGGNLDYWMETGRSGNMARGYFDYETMRTRVFGGFSFNYGGVQFNYHGEWLIKDQEIANQRTGITEDRLFNVFRSKAYMVVNF